MKRMLPIWLIASLALCGCGGGGLTCNFSSADISTEPDEQVVLAGFAARQGLSDGIHLPLKSSCLVINDKGEKVCIISNDLMEISPALSSEIRDSISVRSGLAKERILMHNIHTHSAPRMGGASVEPGGANRSYKDRTVRAIVENAVRTITDDKAFVKFHLEVAKGEAPVNYNRCEPGGPVDPTVYAARFVSGKKPVCALFNIACHPVSMGHKSLLLSSDFSGVARREVAPVWDCEVIQFTGAAGNMDPVDGCKLVDHAEEIGTELAGVLKGLEFSKVPETGLMKFDTGIAHLPYAVSEVTRELVHSHADSISVAYSTEFPRFADDVRRWEEQIISEWDNERKNYKSLDFNLAALNVDGIIFFFTQGEPFCEYQQQAREAHPDHMIFFSGYTNGQNSYLPSAYAYQVRKGYEYEIEQMHIYIKAPYMLSDRMPEAYSKAVSETIEKVL